MSYTTVFCLIVFFTMICNCGIMITILEEFYLLKNGSGSSAKIPKKIRKTKYSIRKAGVKLNLGIETETLEFKKTTGELKEAVNSICAILNKHQKGELYFGVKPDGTPVGQIVTEESLREVSQKIGNFIEPKIYPEVRKVTINDRDCIYVKFEGDNVPYFAYGVAKIRVADEDLTLSPQELMTFIQKIIFVKINGKIKYRIRR